jgi:hypothetical protein
MQHILYYDTKIALIFCKKDFVDIELAEEGVHSHCHKGRDSRMVNIRIL